MTTMRHPPVQGAGSDEARHHLVRAWVATGLVALMLVLMPSVPAILDGTGLGIEPGSFLASAGVLAVFVLLLDLFAIAAIVSAGRAGRAGSGTAGVPQVLSAGAAVVTTLLLAVTVLAHLFGFE